MIVPRLPAVVLTGCPVMSSAAAVAGVTVKELVVAEKLPS